MDEYVIERRLIKLPSQIDLPAELPDITSGDIGHESAFLEFFRLVGRIQQPHHLPKHALRSLP